MRCYAVAAAAWCDADCLQLCSFTRISYGPVAIQCHWSRWICRFEKLNWYLWFVLFSQSLIHFIYLFTLFTCVLFLLVSFYQMSKNSLHLSIKAYEQYRNRKKKITPKSNCIHFYCCFVFCISVVYLICLMLKQTLKKVQSEMEKNQEQREKGTDSTFKKNVFQCL